MGKRWYDVDLGPVWVSEKTFRMPSRQIRIVTFSIGQMTCWVCSGCHCVIVLVRDASSYVMVNGCFVSVSVGFSHSQVERVSRYVQLTV